MIKPMTSKQYGAVFFTFLKWLVEDHETIHETILWLYQRHLISCDYRSSTVNNKIHYLHSILSGRVGCFWLPPGFDYTVDRPPDYHCERIVPAKPFTVNKWKEMMTTESSHILGIAERNKEMERQAGVFRMAPRDLLQVRLPDGTLLCKVLHPGKNYGKPMSYHGVYVILNKAIIRVGLDPTEGYRPESFTLGLNGDDKKI